MMRGYEGSVMRTDNLKNQKDKVSIIIPVYNGERYLKEAIDSALAQTYSNLEVIVINDGSVDRTEDIALSYGNKIRYFSKKNGGVASALNLGISVMQGEYFSWLSHDDIYLEDKIEKQMEILNNADNPNTIIWGNWLQKNMCTGQTNQIPPLYRFTIDQIQAETFPVLFGLINGCTLLIHKSHFKRVGVFDEKLTTAQDYDFWFRLMRGQKTIYVQEYTVVQRLHEQQGSNTIPEFTRNCEENHMKMSKALTDNEIECLFGGKYKFYYDMLFLSERNQWKECIKYYYSLLVNEKQEGRLINFFQKERRRLVLYCAGKNGMQLKYDLYMKGIDIDCFCDKKEEYHNKMLNGVICIPPQLLKKNDYIIVTKDYPEDIVFELKKQNFQNVIAYSRIAKELFMAVPIKKRVIQYYGESNIFIMGTKGISKDTENEKTKEKYDTIYC